MSATLKATVRQKMGSRWARRLRLQGKVPACVQGEGKENLNVALDEAELLAARRHHEHLFDLELDSGGEETALIRELQWGPFGERILHVEFRRVIRGQKTQAEVDLEFVGHPKGGILNQLLTHVTVSALPSEIPDMIEVKVDELEIGTPFTIADLAFPEGVEAAMDPETQVCSVVQPKGEDAEGTEEEGLEGAEDGTAPAPAEGGSPDAG